MNRIDKNMHQAGDIVSRFGKRLIFAFVSIHLLSMFIVLSGMSPLANKVAAWCEPNAGIFGTNDTFTEECKLDNLKEIEKLPANRVLSLSEYESKIEDCRNGDAAGWDNSPSELNYSVNERKARCANAVVSCQKYAIDIKDCTANNLKTISGSECNSGRLSGNENDDCQRLKEINGAQIDKLTELACEGEPGNNATSAQLTNECKTAVSTKCIGSGILNDDGTVKGSSFEDAQKCAQEEGKKLAQSEAACDARGGIWVAQDYKDPVAGSNSNVSKGCKSNYGDLINEPACTAAGGKWLQTGGLDTSKTQDDSYGCKDPNGDTPKDPNGNDIANPVINNGGTTAVTGQCGKARTNLLNCGAESDATKAFNSVLKIVVLVLTTLVGIAAVGGLAWAAVLYAKAEDNQSNVQEAKELIRNVVIGILLYGFLVAITNWLVPGGVIG